MHLRRCLEPLNGFYKQDILESMARRMQSFLMAFHGLQCIEIVIKFLTTPTEPVRALKWILLAYRNVAEEWASKKLF